MTADAWNAAGRLSELRRGFDESFAQAPRPVAADHADLIAIRLAGLPYAFRRTDVGALTVGRRPVPLPSGREEFLGLAAFRGQVVPVYCLRALLGHPRGDVPRWVVLTATDARVGLAFDAYEGFVRVPSTAITGSGCPGGPSAHVREVARQGERVYPILSVSSLLDALKTRPPTHGPSQE